tara:strand:+ start:528 stop:740 length:213 start_codon:yes stop_codon:yes gene_type:complete
MASIQERHNKNGTITYRVQIRRKGLKMFSTSFSTEEDAKEFIEKYEKPYCLDPINFGFDRLMHHREREFV